MLLNIYSTQKIAKSGDYSESKNLGISRLRSPESYLPTIQLLLIFEKVFIQKS